MAKSDLSKDERKALKAAKKAEKSTLADAGVNGSSKHKSEKKDKKDKKKREALAELALNGANGESDEVNVVVKEKKSKDADVAADSDEDGEGTKVVVTKPIGALVPFAVPLADDKIAKKAFKSVKKGMKSLPPLYYEPLTCTIAAAQRTLKRGVKEVVKALRKSPNDAPANSASSDPIGVVILAADISPMDVISHIPVLCEDHNIPYIFVQSRAELGLAGGTKRPTSVVMVSRDPKSGGDDEWKETYASLAKTVLREGAGVKR
jgi:H/ACA ribonucleoprotein complex subunit 2